MKHQHHHNFVKYTSIIYRHGNRFFDQKLAKHGIGCGQQFFLLRIFENEGISMYDLACLGHFDKGTVTRAIRRLEEQSYIRIETAENDRRYRRLYTTEKAKPLIEEVYQIRKEWCDILAKGMRPEEVVMLESMLRKMTQNAYEFTHDKEVTENE